MTPGLFVHVGVLRHLAGVPVRPYEVGGWLLGFWSENEDAVFVTHATPPASRGTPFGVHISGCGHQKKFDSAWNASGGAVTFLGDWHTHPGSPPLPSPTDERALKKLATDATYGTPQPLIAILATPRWPHRPGQTTIAFYLRASAGKTVGLEPNVTKELPEQALAVPPWRWPQRRRVGGGR
ncbi:MAG: hypothetical protein QOC78_214 [Solirubrobacteraceae bacterium]|jgi:integrative and conjugative element protein (TIGR02256 family)|nr:hypothetical protein [Solirubrobacteraceae bacterium]